jgi:CHRD domain-containing protein
MPRIATRSFVHCLLILVAAIALVSFSSAYAAETQYVAYMLGSNEAPTPNNSPGVGTGYAYIDPVAHTMRVIVDFANLTVGNTACHIHGATAVAFTGTAGVATTTPTFTGFPGGVTVGTYDHTFDTSLTASFNGSFVTANGGTASGAEAALFAAIAAGKAYVNIHTGNFPGGEIRGFLVPFDPTPNIQSTWGKMKALYR